MFMFRHDSWALSDDRRYIRLLDTVYPLFYRIVRTVGTCHIKFGMLVEQHTRYGLFGCEPERNAPCAIEGPLYVTNAVESVFEALQ